MVKPWGGQVPTSNLRQRRLWGPLVVSCMGFILPKSSNHCTTLPELIMESGWHHYSPHIVFHSHGPSGLRFHLRFHDLRFRSESPVLQASPSSSSTHRTITRPVRCVDRTPRVRRLTAPCPSVAWAEWGPEGAIAWAWRQRKEKGSAKEARVLCGHGSNWGPQEVKLHETTDWKNMLHHANL